tara:strand:+ start:600 stop:1475 length:876 start_codon:yes stop_codon:yes gene_type:complete
MGQKIVITANMNNKTQRIERKEVQYQWHWRRIVGAATLGLCSVAAIWYLAFTPANAEQGEVNTASSDGIQSQAEAPNESAHEDTVAKAAPVALAAQAPVQSSQPHKEDEVEADSKSAMVESEQTLVAQVSTNETSTVESSTSASSTEAQANDTAVDAPAPESEFNTEAKVASLSQGTKIDTDKVSRAVLTTAVQDREPINSLGQEVKTSDFQQQLFFFTELHGLQGQKVKHVWYFNDQTMANVELGVHTTRYRTFSSKNIMPSQLGTWRVELRDENNKLLATRAFRLVGSR